MTKTITLSSIPTGKRGVEATLYAMRNLVRAGKVDYAVRQKAVELVRDIRPQKHYYAMARAIHAFVRDCIAYVLDINGIETLHPASVVLENRAGDCDDKAILLCALLESLGFQTRLRAVATPPYRECNHVLADVWLNGQWVALETTENVPVGWTPPVTQQATLEN